MQSTNFDNSLDMKPVMFEHDYCRNGDIRDVEDRKYCAYNVFGKKRSRHFGAVDKWTHRLLVNVTTGGDWNKIVDRETAILKVQYPFLPEQQLRGKAYKKFGIPTVMGVTLSRVFGGADRMSRYKDEKKSKYQSEFAIGLKENFPPDIDDAVPNTRRSAIGTDDTESLTPSFGFLDTTSIFSKSTQRFKQYTRPSDTPDGIYSASTEKIERDFQRFHNRADVNDNLTGGSPNQCEISLLNNLSIDSSVSIESISSTEMLTHKKIENNNRHTDFNTNDLKVTFPRKAEAESISLRPAFGFSRKTSNEQQNGPIFDIVDIGDFSQLATPNFGHFELAKLSESQSPSDPSQNDSFDNYRNTPDEPKQILINNELKRKRKADRRAITSTENKENDPVIINFQHEKLHAKKLGLTTNAKNPFAFDDTLTLVLQARDLNLNGPLEKSGDASSPDSASPENKKRRLCLQDSPLSASFHPREKKNRLHIVGVTQEKNTAEEPSVELRKNAEAKPSAKPASEVKLPTIASNDSWEVETTAESSLDVVGDDGNQNVAQKLMADDKRPANIVKNSSEKSGDAFSSDSASPEVTKRRLSLQDSPISTSFHPRGREESIHIVDVTQEKNTTEEPSVELRNNAEEKPSAKPASEVKLPTIASNDSWEVETTAESSLDVVSDDGNQNMAQKLMADDKRPAITVKNSSEKSGDAFSSDSASPEVTKRRLSLQDSPISTSFHPRGRKESIHIIDVTQEKNTAEEPSVELRNNAEAKLSAEPASEVKLPTIASNDSWEVEMTAESCLDVVSDDGNQNMARKLMADDKRPAATVKNSSEQSGDGFSSDSASPETTKRRRSLQDSPTLVTKNCGSTPYYPRRKKKRVIDYIPVVDLTREDDTNVCNSFNDEENEKNTEKSGDAFSSDSASSEIKKRRQSFESSPMFYIENCGSTPFYPRGKKKREVDFVDLTHEDDTNVCKSFNNEKNMAKESPVVPRKNAQEKPLAKPVSDVKLKTIDSNDDCDIETTAESFLDVEGDGGKQNVSQKLTAHEKRSPIDLSDSLDPEATVESPSVSPTADDESSPSSATTNFTQSSSFSSTLLSDRCSEYDQCLQDENLSHRNLAENTICVSNFIARFDVDTDVIHEQVDNILTFLEADIDTN